MGARGVVLTAWLASVTLTWLYVPVPPSFSRRWAFSGRMAAQELSLIGIDLVDYLGIQPWYISTKHLTEILKFRTDPPEGVRVTNSTFDGISVKIYQPAHTGSNLLPGLVFYHGGGWIKEITPERQLLKMVTQLDAVVVAVDFRLSPEFTFPIPLEDCLAATKHFLSNSAKYEVDPKRIGIAGDSSGGNLAAAVALKLRDEGFYPQPKIQALIYPPLQAIDFRLPSYVQNSEHRVPHTVGLLAGTWSVYLTGDDRYVEAFLNNSHTTPAIKKTMATTHLNPIRLPLEYHNAPYHPVSIDYGDEDMWSRIKATMLNPYFAPLVANDVSKLPKTFIYCGHFDVLRDDSILYAFRLKKAGVDVTLFRDIHGFPGIFMFDEEFQEGHDAMQQILEFLSKNL